MAAHDPLDGIATTFGLGPIDQISFAVEDVAARLPVYRAMFGDFAVHRVVLDEDRTSVRGVPTAASLVLAFGRCGPVEVELVQVTSGDWPTLEHLRRFGEGLHHVRFPVDDHRATSERLVAAGFTTILQGGAPDGTTFSYVEAPAQLGHSVVELIEFGGGTA